MRHSTLVRRGWALLAFFICVACTDRAGPSPSLVLSSDSVAFTAVVGGSNPANIQVLLIEPEGRVLTGLAAGTIAYGAGAADWLAASLSGTEAPATLTLSATLGALAAGTYTASVPISADQASNGTQELTVTFLVAGSGSIIALSPNTVTFQATTGGPNPVPGAVTITNGGTDALSGLAISAVQYAPSQPTGWLTPTLNGTTAPTSVTLQATTGALGPGTYAASLTVSSALAINSPQTITVGFTVAAQGGSGLINAACNPYPTPNVPDPLRTFYVDNAGGSDANNGTSPATAWQTLGRANNAVIAGDLVLLRGVFVGQNIRPAVSGTPSNKIVYRALPGDSARIQTGQFDVALWLDNRNHIVVDGIEINNVNNPFLIRQNGSNNWLFNLYIRDSGGSIISNSDDNRVEGVTLLRIGNEISNAGDAIFIQDGADRNIIVRNTVSLGGHGTVWISFQSGAEQVAADNVIAQNDMSNPWASGMGLNGKAVRTIVECNRIYNSASGAGVNYARSGIEIEGVDNIVRFNEVFRNGAYGITVQGRTFSGFLQNASGNQIYGNTFWQNGVGSIELVQRDAGTVRNNVFENNIHWNDDGFVDGANQYSMVFDMFNANAGNALPNGDMGGNIVRYSIFPTSRMAMLVIRKAGDGGNLAYTFAQAMAAFTGWERLRQVDPLFLDEVLNDVRLQTTSLAIDSGRVIAAHPFLGPSPDLGAREIR